MASHHPLEDTLGGDPAQAQGGAFEERLGQGEPGAPVGRRPVLPREGAQHGRRRHRQGGARAGADPAAAPGERRRRREQVDGGAAGRPGGGRGGEGAGQGLHHLGVHRLRGGGGGGGGGAGAG